jgi:Fe-S cluster assembly ATPase SufC
MPSFVRNLKIINNNGDVNFADGGNITPIAVSKTYNGSGGSSFANILNGRRTSEEAEGEALAVPLEEAELQEMTVEEEAI